MTLGVFVDFGSAAIAFVNHGGLIAASVIASGSLLLLSSAVWMSSQLLMHGRDAPEVLQLPIEIHR